jgi:hypothetical protein
MSIPVIKYSNGRESSEGKAYEKHWPGMCCHLAAIPTKKILQTRYHLSTANNKAKNLIIN